MGLVQARQEEREVLLMVTYKTGRRIAGAGMAVLMVALINAPGFWWIAIAIGTGFVTGLLLDIARILPDDERNS